MKIRFITICAFLLFNVFVSTAYSEEITWKLFLKPYIYDGPVLTKTLQTGQQFTIENYSLSGGQSKYSELMNALRGSTFSLAQLPTGKPAEIRIILNIASTAFERAGTIQPFINITFEVLISGRVEQDYRFASGAPLTMTIPSGSGLNYILDMGNCKRSDSIMFVFYNGRDFEKEGIETLNQTSGLSARIDHAATILGGTCSAFGFPPVSQFSTWRKIKELFAK
ncbi:hypothetical protein LLG96_04770 [bacterium]|nr:hypothetical protein [bacterium]